MLNLTEEMKQELIDAGWIAPPKKLTRVGKLVRDEHGSWILFDQSGNITFNEEFDLENFNGFHVKITIEEQR
jgi:hypothetical protein